MRRSGGLAAALGVGLAACGALVAYLLAGGKWAVAGVVLGAVTGAFAPSVYDGIREHGTARGSWRGTVEPLPEKSLAGLLDPRLQIVGFVGRQGELAGLVAWCLDDHAGRLRLVTGPGGVGKTRLAVELMSRMTARGWSCERVAYGQEVQAIPALRAVTGKRALLVVDYAETRIGLRQMLAILASNQGEGVRALLLARSAGEWWDQLGAAQPEIRRLAQDAKSAELDLSPVVDPDISDARVIALAVGAFAGEVDVPERAVAISGGSGTTRRRVLDLHAAALVGLLADPGAEPVQVDIAHALEELLGHERRFWYDSAQASGISGRPGGAPLVMLRQFVAAGCLLGAATEAEARQLADRIPGASASAKMARWLRDLYPPGPGEVDWLGSLQPDRLAELHTVRELAGSPEFTQACLRDLDARQARRAVTLLAHASSDDPQAEALLTRTLPDVAGFIEDLDAPSDTLAAIYNAIPYRSVSLAQTALVLAQRITALLPDDSDPALRAFWLSDLGMRFSTLERPAEALPVTEEAVAIRRELATVNPERYRPDLAQSLTNLGVWFWELGRPAEALPVIEEAVAILRELAAVNPDRYRPALAQSLNNLGVQFSALRRPAEALPVTEEAVAIRRELAAVNPERYRPDLAQSLSILARVLAQLGRTSDARAADTESMHLRWPTLMPPSFETRGV